MIEEKDVSWEIISSNRELIVKGTYSGHTIQQTGKLCDLAKCKRKIIKTLGKKTGKE